MAATVLSLPSRAHHVLPEAATRAAKADLRKPEDLLAHLPADARGELGQVLERARCLAGWSLKELAAEMTRATGAERDPRQVARWIAGAEPIQFHVAWSVRRLRRYLLAAMAEQTPSTDVGFAIRVGGL